MAPIITASTAACHDTRSAHCAAASIVEWMEDVIMPPIGKLLGHVNFSDLYINLSGETYKSLADAKAHSAATLNYGLFLNTVINFLIVAFAVFLVVHQVNRWTKKPEAPAAATTKDCPQCAMTIPIAAKRCGHCTSQLA